MPTVNARSTRAGSSQSSSHMRARTSAVTSSACGWSGTPAIASAVAQRRTGRAPSIIIASRTEPTRCERAKMAELA